MTHVRDPGQRLGHLDGTETKRPTKFVVVLESSRRPFVGVPSLLSLTDSLFNRRDARLATVFPAVRVWLITRRLPHFLGSTTSTTTATQRPLRVAVSSPRLVTVSKQRFPPNWPVAAGRYQQRRFGYQTHRYTAIRGEWHWICLTASKLCVTNLCAQSQYCDSPGMP